MNKQLLFLSLSATILLSSAMSVAANEAGAVGQHSAKVVSVNQQDPLKIMVSIDVNGVSPTAFFAELKSKTKGKINFAYAVADLAEIKSITLKRNNIAIGELLKEVFAPFKSLSFSVSNNTIVISKATTKASELPQATMITGRVTDNNGLPVVGAVVRVKDTNNGCATDRDGHYVLAVPDGPQTILVSMIGMETRTINYGGQKVLNISMKESVNKVDDVVVTGMSQRSKESFTGGYVTVKGEQLKTLNPNNLLQALQFFDPSFKVVENETRGADPNARLKFQIRGDAVLGNLSEANTMDQLLDNVSSQPNEPLFVLDGFIVGLSRIMELDVERVESMTILKDAAACAIYGSRAANGVIVVTTKVAPEGKLSISYSTNVAIQTPDLSDYNLMNAAEKLELEWKGGLYNTSSATSMNTYNDYLKRVLAGVNTYWLSQPLQTAVQNRHSVSIGGGTNLFRYQMSANASFSPGIMKGSSNNNKGINLSIQYNEEKWRLGLTVNVIDANGHNSPYGSFSDYTTINPYYELTNEYGEYEQILDYKSLGSGYNRRTITNPLYNTQFKQKDMTNSLNLSNGLNLEYAPRQNLRFTLQMSYIRGVARQEKFLPANHTSFANEQDLTKRGSYSKNSGESNSWSSNLGYNYNFVKGKHLFSNFGNWTVNEDRNNYVTLSATGYPNEYMSDFILGYDMNMRPAGSEAISRSMGFTEQLSYSYDHRYSFDANVRADISSRFGSNHRIAPFYSLGARWNIHNEKWMPKGISQLILRATYGVTGSQNYEPYQAIEFYSYSDTMIPYEGSSVIGALLKGLPNDELGWSKTDNASLSLDLSLFKGRINLTGSLYNNITRELLVDNTLAPSTGFDSKMMNVGELQNRGYDFMLSAIVVNDVANRLNWVVNFNGNHNRNKIRKISNALKALNEQQLATQGAPLPVYQEGQSTTTIYLVQSLGIDPASGDELYLTRDGKRTKQWNAADKIVAGDTNPTLSGTVSTALNWGNLTFNLACEYRFGGQLYNTTLVDKIENMNIAFNGDRRALTDRWTAPDDVARYKKIDREGNNTPQSTRFLMDERLFKFSTLTLGYRFRDVDFPFLRQLNIANVSLNASTQDILRLSSIKIERGLDYPFAQTYNLSLSILFN